MLRTLSRDLQDEQSATDAPILHYRKPNAEDMHRPGQMLQMCNASMLASNQPVIVTAPVPAAVNVLPAASGNSLSSQMSNVDARLPNPINVTAACARNNELTATSSVASMPEKNYSMSKASGVSEQCFKEALFCEISHLGYHLPLAIKEKIWKREFVDLLSLLLTNRENLKNEKKSEEIEEKRKRLANKSFYNWLQAFCRYASILGEKQPHLCSGLFRHLD